MSYELHAVESDQSPENQIRESRTFDELYDTLDSLGRIHGSQGVYSADEIIGIVEKVRSGELTIDYVTRTYGLRDKVSELLVDSKPVIPPPQEAAVALDIPVDKPADKVGAESGAPTPEDGPQPPHSQIELDVPRESQPDTVENETEPTEPKGPITPLSHEERDFYEQAKVEYEQRFSDLYKMNVESAPDRYLNLNDPIILERFETVSKKADRIKNVADPRSFDELMKSLQNSVIETSDGIIPGSEVAELVKQVRHGEVGVEDLPELVREGVVKLIANEVFERLASTTGATIKSFEWKCFQDTHRPNQDFLGSRNRIGYPALGESGVRVKENTGVVEVEGVLVWADAEVVIFKDGEVFKSKPTKNILMQNGNTFTENTESQRNVEGSQAMQREIPRQ